MTHISGTYAFTSRSIFHLSDDFTEIPNVSSLAIKIPKKFIKRPLNLNFLKSRRSKLDNVRAAMQLEKQLPITSTEAEKLFNSLTVS